MKPLQNALLVYLGCISTLWSAEIRDWSNSSGKTRSAKLVKIIQTPQGQASAVELALENGQLFTLELSALSEADREYVKSQQKKAAEEKKQLTGRKAKWTEDWGAAQAESKSTGLPILLFRTGSDWCPGCMKLKSDLFESFEFRKFANSNLVLMLADHPKYKKQSEELKKQNRALESKYPGPRLQIIKDSKVLPIDPDFDKTINHDRAMKKWMSDIMLALKDSVRAL